MSKDKNSSWSGLTKDFSSDLAQDFKEVFLSSNKHDRNSFLKNKFSKKIGNLNKKEVRKQQSRTFGFKLHNNQTKIPASGCRNSAFGNQITEIIQSEK